LIGRTPEGTGGEALVAAAALRAPGRTASPADAPGACAMLDSARGNGLIYDSRPFGSRAHFCAAAGGPYARREVIDLIRRLEAVDAGLGGEGPRTLPASVADALDGMR